MNVKSVSVTRDKFHTILKREHSAWSAAPTDAPSAVPTNHHASRSPLLPRRLLPHEMKHLPRTWSTSTSFFQMNGFSTTTYINHTQSRIVADAVHPQLTILHFRPFTRKLYVTPTQGWEEREREEEEEGTFFSPSVPFSDGS